MDRLSGWNAWVDKCFHNLDRYYEMIIDEHLQNVAEISEDEKDFSHMLVELSLKDPRFRKDDIKALLNSYGKLSA